MGTKSDIIKSLADDFKAGSERITGVRKKELLLLASRINEAQLKFQGTDLLFVCTHNSRRSHLSQVWAQVAANHFNHDKISCFSGGTEVTQIYKSVISTLEGQGFDISDGEENEHREIALGSVKIEGFSKKYDDPFNPTKDFIAVMTCDHANDNCPVIPAAYTRIPITYVDPKKFDGTDKESAEYLKTSIEIGTEMFYMMSNVLPR